MHQLQQLADACISKFKAGELREADLQELVARVSRPHSCQQLLYLQVTGTAVTSPVLGMALYTDGQFLDAPIGTADWPYGCVADAMKDGWRVIKFPELALLLDSNRTYALGCEFILEKWE